MDSSTRTACDVRRAHGPRALERLLFRELVRRRDEVRADVASLARPVWMVVPSHGLREHLVCELPRLVGGAQAGVRVTTHAALAQELLRRAALPLPRGARAFELYTARAVRKEPELAAVLGEHESARAAAAATLSDLLDAGYTPAHEDAAREALEARTSAAPQRARALALLAAARSVTQAFHADGLARGPDSVRAATALVREPTHVLACGELWIHGYPDATGIVADFLATLASRAPRALFFWDDATTQTEFGAALRERFGVQRATHDADSAASIEVESVVTCFQALDRATELRGTAHALRRALDAGVRAETLAVVARDLEPYRLLVHATFERAAVPYCAPSLQRLGARAARRVAALASVVSDGARAPLERWRVAAGDPDVAHDPAHELDLHLGLRSIGVARLADLATLDLERVLGTRLELVLPSRSARPATFEGDDDPARVERDTDDDQADDGVDEDALDAEVASPELQRRTLSRAALERARARAAAWLEQVTRWPSHAPLAAHVQCLHELLREVLPNSSSGDHASHAEPRADAAEFHEHLARVVALLTDDLPHTLALERREFLDLFERAATELARTRSSNGGGVQLLTALEARGRTFARVHVIGLEAGVFPAAAREDPLLADALRAPLRVLLPDLAQKRTRAQEEQALFAQLLASAPDVLLSWSRADDEGAPRAPSPYFDAAGCADPLAVASLGSELDATEENAATPGASAQRATTRHAATDVGADARNARAPARSPFDVALAFGRSSGVAGLEFAFDLAIAHARGDMGLERASAPRIATARLAALHELDGAPRADRPLARIFGAVGTLARKDDLRARELFVSDLENLASCPWQTLLGRVLRVRPPPDPLAELPSIDPRVIGDAVHALLAQRAPSVGGNFEERRSEEGRAPHWPDARELQSAVEHELRTQLARAGVAWPGFERLLAPAVLERLALARALEREDPDLRIVAAELEGGIELELGRVLRFRADRLERVGRGLRLVDFKTGKTFKDAVKAEKRTERVRAKLAQGTALQAYVYALLAGEGRYVLLVPDAAYDGKRVFTIDADDDEAARAFEHARRALYAAWEVGSFFPRLTQPDGRVENRACAHCDYRLACIQGDSGARARLVRFALARVADTPAQHALLDVWHLGEKPARTKPVENAS